jgi:hypothetical protein
MQVLRDGEAAAQAYDLRYIKEEAGLFLPDVADLHTTYSWFPRTIVEDGEEKKVAYCGYYDALELMDLFISLEEAAGVKHHA